MCRTGVHPINLNCARCSVLITSCIVIVSLLWWQHQLKMSPLSCLSLLLCSNTCSWWHYQNNETIYRRWFDQIVTREGWWISGSWQSLLLLIDLLTESNYFVCITSGMISSRSLFLTHTHTHGCSSCFSSGAMSRLTDLSTLFLFKAFFLLLWLSLRCMSSPPRCFCTDFSICDHDSLTENRRRRFHSFCQQ